jgi:acyl-CoA hydrolase
MNARRLGPSGPVPPEAVLDHVGHGADIIVPLANGEPVAVLDAIEAAHDTLQGVRVHQMHALHDRPYLRGEFGDQLRHVSYFLSHVTRPYFHAGSLDLVPNNFSEMRLILEEATTDPLVVAAASPPDRHGYFSLGVSADYVSSLIGRARFFLEANHHMPRTFGRNQIHISQVVGYCESDRPLIEVPPPPMSAADRAIADLVAERIPHRATIQTGIGSIPNAIMSALRDHQDLGVHTELLSDGVIDLIESGVVNGVAKSINRTKTIGTFALGTTRLYDFLHDNAAVELWPVRYVSRTSFRSTQRLRSTSSASARRRRSTESTSRHRVGRPTLLVALYILAAARVSLRCTLRPPAARSPRSFPGFHRATLSRRSKTPSTTS